MMMLARKRILLLTCVFIAALELGFLLLGDARGPPSMKNQFPNEDELIDVVLSFPLLTDPNWNSSEYHHLSYSQRDARMDEYLHSLKNTLAHPRIGIVHCLHDQTELSEYIKDRISSDKLQLHHIKDTHLALSIFRFVFEALYGHLVMVMQADTYPAQDFEKVVGDTMRKKRLFYALTRHGKMEGSCDMSPGEFCDTAEYVGSHDAYLFVPTGELSTRHRDILKNKNVMAWGIDLVIAWVFSDMGYKVINPCKRIFIYHLHCSGIRNTGRFRVNDPNITGWFPPTSRLE